MATRAERRKVLEAMTLTELAAFEKSFGGTWYSRHERDEAAAIAELLAEADHYKGIGDRLDRRFDLPTEAEQRLELQRKAVATSTSSTRASWASAPAAWIAAVFAVLAAIIAIIALLK